MKRLLLLLSFIITLQAEQKIALIFGVTGQDGAYLSELLLSKGYVVHGVKRRSSSINTKRIDHLYQGPEQDSRNFILHYGDLTDSSNIVHLMQTIKPDEVYNLAAQSHVKVSFELPEYTGQVDALGTLAILEAIRIAGLAGKTRFYQAGTSEMFGKVQEIPQRETTPFYPRSPYGVAKVYAYWITKNYRESYGMFACNGILFNHESPNRGETFVTRKVTRAVSRIALGLQDKLLLGNLNAQRDWGHAKDYVQAMWLMLQAENPDDYIAATGQSRSIREFVEAAFAHIGIEIAWKGKGLDEIGYDIKTGKEYVFIDERYFRPAEVEYLCGDPSKIKDALGWQPSHTFEQLVADMMAYDLKDAKREALLKKNGL